MNAPITTTPAGDLLANIHELEWLDVGGGTQFKILRICEKTEQWARHVDMEPGHDFKHIGTRHRAVFYSEWRMNLRRRYRPCKNLWL